MQVWTPKSYDAYVDAALAGMNPLSDEARKLNRFFGSSGARQGSWPVLSTDEGERI